MEKKRQHNELVLQVDNRSFTPLIFLINVGNGREASKCYSRIAETLAEKSNEDYSVTMSWIHRKILFAIMQSIIMIAR